MNPPQQDSGDDWVGRTFSHFRVLSVLGEGGMGRVYRAEDLRLGRDVALKVVREDRLVDPERRTRFVREARVLASLNHPNIATLFGLEELDGRTALVMELVEGETLSRRISRGPLARDEITAVFRQVAEALAAAHDQGIVHRDLKPSNIQLTSRARVKLLDFGLAKAVASPPDGDDPSRTIEMEQEVTAAGLLVGTLSYMSPEQARGREVDAATDVWAFGCCLFEALSGAPLFRGASPTDTLARVLTLEPAWSDLPPWASTGMALLLRACLRKNPRERLRSIQQARQWLDGELSDSALNTPSASPSVAALPFYCLGDDPETEIFAEGMTEDVIAQLTKVDDLKVIARSSVMPFQGRDRKLDEIGKRLGVSTILDGSVRRVGRQVRIVVQLVATVGEEPLWTETYDRRLDDIFAIQSDVALRIAEALETELSIDQRERIRKRPTDNLEAYRLVLLGRQQVQRYTDDGIRSGLEHYGRAIRLDPEYALAHAETAQAHIVLGMGFGSGRATARESYSRAEEAANVALQTDSNLAEAHSALGFLRFVSAYDWTGAERSLRRALALNPGNARCLAILSLLLSARGRNDEAISTLLKALELDPLTPVLRSDLATKYVRAGRYDEAILEARKLIEIEPDFPPAHSVLGWALLRSGRTAEGLEELERATRASPDNIMFLAQLGQAYAEGGEVGKARDVLRLLEQRASHQYVSPYHLAYVYTGLGERDRAVEHLEKAFQERASGLYGVKGSFLFASLHENTGFQDLMRRMNLG